MMMMNSLGIAPYPSNPSSWEESRNIDRRSQADPLSPVPGDFYDELPRGGVPSSPAVSGEEARKNGKNSGGDFDRFECQTCKNRKYQDGSNDPGVSFKTPTALEPHEAAAAVRSHESEHVNREQAAADREGKEVVSQSVSYQSAICPECGQVYISGGTTRTVTKSQIDRTYGLNMEEKGRYLDKTA